jgi:hypothetical protein
MVDLRLLRVGLFPYFYLLGATFSESIPCLILKLSNFRRHLQTTFGNLFMEKVTVHCNKMTSLTRNLDLA